MTLTELQKIVSKGEGLFTEFKHKINFPDKIAREVVAFANTAGGNLFIGVDDNKTIFGLKNVDEEVFAFEQLIKNYIKFPVNYSLEKIKVHPKKDVLAVKIQESTQKPVFALEDPKHRFGTAYVRVKDKSVKASNEMLKILKLQAAGIQTGITFGEQEKKVLKLIEKDGFVTLKKLQDEALVSTNTASDLLVNMTLAGVLSIEAEEEKEDRFFLRE